MQRNNYQLQSDIRALELKVSQLTDQASSVNGNTSVSRGILGQPLVASPSLGHSVANQARNGDLSHSNRTWFETTATDDNQNKECAWWFCHDAPVANQQLYENTSKTGGSPNNALKMNSHAAYSAARSDWDRATGQGRLTGTKTLDAPLPQNLAGAGKTEYLVMILARRNQYISLGDNHRMFGGVWDNTSGQRDWLKASATFHVSGGVTNTPSSTLERRYKIFARTDRGYTFLSDELVVTNAPSGTAFVPNSVYVALQWTPIPEVLAYDVYRYTPSSGVYELLSQVTSGANTYNDQNPSPLASPAGYPTASNDREIAYFATRTGELSNLSVNGISSAWDTLTLRIKIPAQYNQGATTDKQWIRFGLSLAPDLKLTDGATNGTTTVTSAAAQFTAEMVGLPITVSDATHTLTTTIASFTSATTIVLSSAPGWTSSNNNIFVTGGGVHGVLVDLIHSSFVSGALYAPYFEDLNRPLPASATPNGSSQGGTGTPSTGGGIHCVWAQEKVWTYRGNQAVPIPANEIRIGDALCSGNLRPNFVKKIITGTGETFVVETSNGCRKRCTGSHRLITSVWDEAGTALQSLKIGDVCLTEMNGKLEWSIIAKITPSGKTENVITFSLTPGEFYMAGEFCPSGMRGWLKRLIYFVRAVKITGAIAAHNRKRDDFILTE